MPMAGPEPPEAAAARSGREPASPPSREDGLMTADDADQVTIERVLGGRLRSELS